MREAPALSPITSSTSAGSSPARCPRTKASAVDKLWMVTRWLAMNFILLPWPKGPTYLWARDMPVSTSFAHLNAASSPLQKTTRSFRAACAPVPLTGQSSRILPCPASVARPRSFASSGSVLHSMTICPLPLLDAMPPWPDVTCSKASTLGSEVIRISTRSATSRGELAAMPPASARRCIAASATSKPTTSNPSFARLRIIAVPMMPMPTMPTRFAMSSSFCGKVENRDRARPARPDALQWRYGTRAVRLFQRSEPVRLGIGDHHACSVQRRSRAQNDVGSTGLFSLRIPEFESRHPGIVMVRRRLHRGCLPKSLPQLHIRNAAAHTRTVLCCAVSANSLKNLAVAQADFDPDGFRGSSPTTPATQSGNADHSRTYPAAISLNRRKVSM